MTNWRSSVSLLIVPVVVTSGLACGRADTPPLGQVSGTITLDSQPLAGVIVVFKPDKGRPAVGTTNDSGIYNLEYTYRVNGCKIGPNSVMFEWPLGSANAKPLSDRYTTRSQLKAEVKPGHNKIDFSLESDAKPADTPAVQPLVIPD